MYEDNVITYENSQKKCQKTGILNLIDLNYDTNLCAIAHEDYFEVSQEYLSRLWNKENAFLRIKLF